MSISNINLVKIAKKLTKECYVATKLLKSFNLKNYIKMKKQDLDNPGKDFDVRKQDSKGQPVHIYLQYPKKENPNFWYVFYITDKMQYAEIELFKSEQSAKKYIDDIIKKYERMAERKEQRKKERMEKKINFKHSYQVGDIIVCQWGYDQTNTDFYLVKEIGEKSIKIVEIASKFLKYVDGGNQLVMPNPQKETGKVMTKIVQPGNRVKIYSFADGYKWDGKPVEETSPYNYR